MALKELLPASILLLEITEEFVEMNALIHAQNSLYFFPTSVPHRAYFAYITSPRKLPA